MQRKLLEECEVGDWVAIGDLLREHVTGFEGVLTLPNGEIRRFKDTFFPVEGGSIWGWQRVD